MREPARMARLAWWSTARTRQPCRRRRRTRLLSARLIPAVHLPRPWTSLARSQIGQYRIERLSLGSAGAKAVLLRADGHRVIGSGVITGSIAEPYLPTVPRPRPSDRLRQTPRYLPEQAAEKFKRMAEELLSCAESGPSTRPRVPARAILCTIAHRSLVR